MRILQVCTYYPPRLGGVGEVAAQLHRNYLIRGHDTRVITSNSSSDPGVINIASSKLGFVCRVIFNAPMARHYDVVHCHAGEVFLLPLAMKLLRIKTPILVTMHVDQRSANAASHAYSIDGFKFTMSWAMWWTLKFKEIFHSISQSLMMWTADRTVFIANSTAIQLGRDPKTECVIANGVSENSQTADDPPSAADILYVGSNDFRKRTPTLAFVLKRIKRKVPDVSLTIVGLNHEGISELTKLASQLGVGSNIRFDGPQHPSKMSGYYRSSKILLLTSSYEGLPMVILEAGQYGLPTVATDVGGIGEAIDHGRTGLLVQVDDVDGLADHCVYLLQNEALRIKMGKAIQQQVKDSFSADAIADLYLTQYQELVDHQL